MSSSVLWELAESVIELAREGAFGGHFTRSECLRTCSDPGIECTICAIERHLKAGLTDDPGDPLEEELVKMAGENVAELNWLRVETRTACYAVAFIGTRVVDGSNYGMSFIWRNRKLRDVREFRRYVESRGARTDVLHAR